MWFCWRSHTGSGSSQGELVQDVVRHPPHELDWRAGSEFLDRQTQGHPNRNDSFFYFSVGVRLPKCASTQARPSVVDATQRGLNDKVAPNPQRLIGSRNDGGVPGDLDVPFPTLPSFKFSTSNSDSRRANTIWGQKFEPLEPLAFVPDRPSSQCPFHHRNHDNGRSSCSR